MTHQTRRPVAVEMLEDRRLAAAQPLLRVAALGDSYSDEYRFYPPDRSHAQNWVQQLAENHRVTFGKFTTRTRGAPRNQGYANDWAVSGATVADLPAQTAGVAAQAAAGTIDVATILIGGNDFLNLLESAVLDPSLASTFVATAQAVITGTETAIQTILAASPTVHVVVSTLPPVSALPLVASAEAVGGDAAATLVVAADAAEVQVNAALTAFAATTARLGVADFAAASTAFTASPYTVGRVHLDTATPGDGAKHLFLADGIHPGTVAQGLLANTFLDEIDAQAGRTAKPLTAHQILVDAHLAS